MGRTTDHYMTKIEPYLSLRRLFAAFLVKVFASRCYSFLFFFLLFFFFFFFLFSGRKYKGDNVFFSGFHLGLAFNQFIIYLNENKIYLQND